MAADEPRQPYVRFVEFAQERDCCDIVTADEQVLLVQIEDGGGGPFFVLKTSRWAMDSPEEMAALLDRVKKIL